MTTQPFQISNNVRVGGKLGVIIAMESRPKATIYTIAFSEGPPKKFLSPPTIIEKVYSPVELLKSGNFDSLVKFDLHFEAAHLSLAYEYVTIHRILKSIDLKPHQYEMWLNSQDPEFEAKQTEIVGLYLNPPENAFVLSVNERGRMQALGRKYPNKPLRPGYPESVCDKVKGDHLG